MTLLVEHRPIDLAARDIRALCEVDIDKALIVSEIEIRLRPIVRDKHLAVLIRTHRPRINIDIGVKFLNRNLQPAILQQTTEGSRRNALAER